MTVVLLFISIHTRIHSHIRLAAHNIYTNTSVEKPHTACRWKCALRSQVSMNIIFIDSKSPTVCADVSDIVVNKIFKDGKREHRRHCLSAILS